MWCGHIMDGKLIVSVPRHDGELVDRVNDNNEEDRRWVGFWLIVQCALKEDKRGKWNCTIRICAQRIQYNMWRGFEYNMWWCHSNTTCEEDWFGTEEDESDLGDMEGQDVDINSVPTNECWTSASIGNVLDPYDTPRRTSGVISKGWCVHTPFAPIWIRSNDRPLDMMMATLDLMLDIYIRC